MDLTCLQASFVVSCFRVGHQQKYGVHAKYSMISNNYSGCGAITLRQMDSKVFLAQRKFTKSFDGGLWETIGGGIEPYDIDARACIEREIKEELGTGIKSVQEFKDYGVRKDNHHFLIKVFIVELDKDPNPNPNDFDASGWFDKDEIKELELVSNCRERLEDYFSVRKTLDL